MDDQFVEIGRVFLSHFRRRKTVQFKNLDIRCAFILKLLNKSLFAKIKIYMMPPYTNWNDSRLRDFPDLKVLRDNGAITDISFLKLEVLDLNYSTKLATSIPAQIELRVLHLTKEVKDISTLTKLHKLYCKHADIDIPKSISKLETLHVGKNFDILCHPNIRHLKLEYNANPNNIMYMDRLVSFEALSDKITDMHLGMMPSLKYLKLHRPNITDDGLKHLNLHTFDYYGNGITYNGIKHMNLHVLILNGIDSFDIPDEKIPLFNCILIKYNDGGHMIEFNNHKDPEHCSDRYDIIKSDKKMPRVKTMSLTDIKHKFNSMF